MNFSCESCPWEGDARELEVTEEVDHEVWEVFRCPVCGEECGRQNKRQIRVTA